MVWYSHLLKNFIQFVVVHTVKGFGIVKSASGSSSENPPASAGDIRNVDSIPELGRFPVGGNGTPLQYSRLKLPWTDGTASSWLPSAKSLQLCLILCDPVDGSPPGSAIPGILQARILEWVAISFSNA